MISGNIPRRRGVQNWRTPDKATEDAADATVGYGLVTESDQSI